MEKRQVSHLPAFPFAAEPVEEVFPVAPTAQPLEEPTMHSEPFIDDISEDLFDSLENGQRKTTRWLDGTLMGIWLLCSLALYLFLRHFVQH